MFFVEMESLLGVWFFFFLVGFRVNSSIWVIGGNEKDGKWFWVEILGFLGRKGCIGFWKVIDCYREIGFGSRGVLVYRRGKIWVGR